METTTHTPGPWNVSENRLSVVANESVVIAHAKNNTDAKLIAASPDLLVAVKKIKEITIKIGSGEITRLDEITSIIGAECNISILKAEGI